MTAWWRATSSCAQSNRGANEPRVWDGFFHSSATSYDCGFQSWVEVSQPSEHTPLFYIGRNGFGSLFRAPVVIQGAAKITQPLLPCGRDTGGSLWPCKGSAVRGCSLALCKALFVPPR